MSHCLSVLASNHDVWFFFNKNRTFREETTSVLAGGREKLEKEPGSKVKTYNKLNPQKAPCQNRTQGTLVESKRSHCVIPAPQKEKINKLMSVFYASVLLLVMNFVITLSK